MKKIFFVAFLLVISCFGFVGCGADTKTIVENANFYDIVATLDYEKKQLSAIEKLTYKNNSDKTLSELKFHLHPNAFSAKADKTKAVSELSVDKAYDNGFSEGGITVGGVFIADSEVSFSIEGEEDCILQVPIQNLSPQQEVEVQINFLLTIPNVNHRFGYGEKTLNLGNWYPVVCVLEDDGFFSQGYNSSGDPFYSEVSNYCVTLNYDSKLKVAHTGNLQKQTDLDNKTSITVSAFGVRDFAVVFSENFDVVTDKVDGTTINYFYYDDENYQKNLKTALDAVSTFNKTFGKYPYEVLNVVKANFLHGGMEYPNLVYISDDVENLEEYTKVIIHEIAHQWWYGVVGNNQLNYGWLDEGLAEFSVALFYEKNPSYEITYSETIGNALSSYLLFCDVFKEVYDNLDTSMNRNLTEFKTDTEYVYISYVKGLLMFDAIRDVVGKNKMEKCLQNYYFENSLKIATPVLLIESFEKTSKKDLKSFITSFIDGTVVLEQLNGR